MYRLLLIAFCVIYLLKDMGEENLILKCVCQLVAVLLTVDSLVVLYRQ